MTTVVFSVIILTKVVGCNMDSFLILFISIVGSLAYLLYEFYYPNSESNLKSRFDFRDTKGMEDIEISDYNFTQEEDKLLPYSDYKEKELRDKTDKLNRYIHSFEDGKDEFIEKSISLIKKIESNNSTSDILKVSKDFEELKEYVFVVNKMTKFLEYIENAKKHKMLNNKIDEKEYLNNALREIKTKEITDHDFKIIDSYKKNLLTEKAIKDRIAILNTNSLKEPVSDFDTETLKTLHEINLLKKNLSYVNESKFDNSNIKKIVNIFNKIKKDYNFIKENYNHNEASESLMKLDKKMKNLNLMISEKNKQFLAIYSGDTDNLEDVIEEFDNLTNLLEAENELKMI